MATLGIKQRVALSTALASATMMGYYRRAYAACASTGAATYLCSGTETTTQTITAAGATVTTASNFNLNPAAGEGLVTSGTGNLSVTIGNGSQITATNSTGTSGVRANNTNFGVAGPADVSVTVEEGASVSGRNAGVYAKTTGIGAVAVTVNGNVTGTLANGVFATGYFAGATNVSVTTGSNSNITAVSQGIRAKSYSPADIDITVNGDITSSTAQAIYTINDTISEDINITTGAGSTLTGATRGIHLVNNGNAANVTVNGEVGSTSSHAIFSTNSASSNDVAISTAAASNVHSTNGRGILATNSGTGTTSATVNGIVTSTNSEGIYLRGNATSGAMGVTIGADASITSDERGLNIRNLSTSAGTTVTVNGDITSTDNDSVYASAAAGDVSITQGATSSLVAASDSFGIVARNTGTGAATLVANGSVSGGRVGVYARAFVTGTNTSITTGTTTDISVSEHAVWAKHQGTGTNTVTVNGDMASTTRDAVYMYSGASSTDTSFTLASTGSLTGQQRGIQIFTFGSGDTNITINGDVTATTDAGMYISQAVSTDDVSMTIGNGVDVSGVQGIQLINRGSGDNIVTLNGTNSITGTGGTAMFLSDENVTLAINGNSTIHGDIFAEGASDTLALNNATITMDTGDVINTFESIQVTGNNVLTGNLALGTATLSSATTGNLHVNGNINATTLTLGSGVSLGGNHTLTGNLVLGSGGSVAPGNSIGTQNVVGDITFNNGSVFNVEVDGNSADRLIATGNITINPGATLNVIPLSTFSGSVDILSAGGTLSGTFVTNQNYVFTYYTGSVLSLTAFNNSALNAQISASSGSGLLFSDTVVEKTSDYAMSTGKYFWASGLYQHKDQKTQGLYLGSSTKMAGLALGGQNSLSDQYKIGFSLADITTDSKVKTGAGNSESNGIHASVYGTYTKNKFFATIGGLFGYRQNDTERRVSNTGTIAYAQSDNHDLDVGTMVQLGMQIPVNNWQITPKVNAAYLHTYANGFAETGGGISGVSLDDYDFGTLKTGQSLRFSPQNGYAIKSATAHPYIELGLAQETAVGNRSVSGNFTNGARFTTQIQDENRKFATFKLGTEIDFSSDIAGFANYQFSHASNDQRNDARAGVSIKF